MAKQQPEIVRVKLNADPYATELFCPFCGEQILEPEGEGIGQCPHLIHADIGTDTEVEFLPSDLGFIYFEPAPACREHVFVFREGSGLDDEDGE